MFKKSCRATEFGVHDKWYGGISPGPRVGNPIGVSPWVLGPQTCDEGLGAMEFVERLPGGPMWSLWGPGGPWSQWGSISLKSHGALSEPFKADAHVFFAEAGI